MKIDPSGPAFPAGNLRMQIGDDGAVSPVPGGPNGLTIRAHFAVLAMQGMLANKLMEVALRERPDIYAAVAETAAKHADALIMELNK